MTRSDVRSSWHITLSVWHALLLREAVSRMFSRRSALLWLLLEPVVHILVLALIFSAIRVRHIGGMDTGLWIAAGMLAFFLFQRTAFRGAAALDANQALFTYRQVKPADTVLMRCVLEAVIMGLVITLTLLGLGVAGTPLTAYGPLLILAALAGLWLLAVGCAQTFAAAKALVPEVGHAIGFATIGLAFLSGVIFPLSAIPTPWREWLMLNPVAHGVEAVRAGISAYYHHVPELDLAYLYLAAAVMLALGLAMQHRFRHKVVSL
jgi:capsular polysaccharide transport system permease protein